MMEHPAEMLLNTENPMTQRALFGLVFEETPNYNEVVSGTPKLTWVFSLSSDFDANKSQLVDRLHLDWNTIENTVLKWNRVFEMINGLKNHAEI